ncbi:MAG: HAD family hydrolase [Microbacterium sp.]|uniref:HAD family hydrolase n=1 Tax=Microbacterium sp. TaxID=51671 RepID=UPI003BAF01CE
MPLALFDLDGTLVDQAAAARDWAAEFATTWAIPATQIDAIAARLSERRPKGEVFADLVGEHSLATTADAVWREYRQRMPGLVRCAPADLDGLARLRGAGWTLGIVTNGEVDNQEGKIRSTGLAEMIDGWVISSEVGFRKPDPQIFRALASKLGHALDGWMVGDGLEADITGGTSSGLSTILIAKSESLTGSTAPTAIAPDVAAAVDLILDEARH